MYTGSFKFPHHMMGFHNVTNYALNFNYTSADECVKRLPLSNSAHISFCTVKLKHPGKGKKLFDWRGT